MRKKYSIDYTPDTSFLKFKSLIPHEGDTRLIKAEYLCVCGNICTALINNVKRGKKISCGCKLHLGTPTHGKSEHPLYSVWENMYSRCYNKKIKSYKHYGGRGVEVCEEWRNSPGTFIEWGLLNGWREGLELDKDIKGGMVYSPQTCVFVTSKENSNNRRSNRFITYKGKTQTLAQWADEIGLSHSGLFCRIKKWGLNKALTEPVKNKK